jgi:type I restriction enzyme M protein
MVESNRLPTLAVGDHGLARLDDDVRGELDRVSQSLAGRIRQLAERYANPLPKIVREVEEMAARVDAHLARMGFRP